MSDDGVVVEKKGRGRPAKTDEVKEAKKRKPAAAPSGESPAKRGRGRPKKKGAAAKPKVHFIKLHYYLSLARFLHLISNTNYNKALDYDLLHKPPSIISANILFCSRASNV